MQWAVLAASIIMQVMVLHALVQRQYRRYPVVLGYMITLFVTSIIQVASQLRLEKLLFEKPMPSEHYLYDGLRYLMIFSAAISLIDRAFARHQRREVIRLGLIVGGLLTVFVSYSSHSGHAFKMQLPLIARDLNFAAAIVSLVLWSGLIFSPAKDKTLLLVTAGIGMKFAGEAIGMSLITMTRYLYWPGVFMASASHLLLLYIWWQAFRQTQEETLIDPPLSPA